MAKITDRLKGFLGVNDIETDDEFQDEFNSELKEEKKESLQQYSEIKEVQQRRNTEEKEETEDKEGATMGEYQSVFIDAKDFADCKKIAKFIKENRMVTINFEYLDPTKAQRVMDFLMGTMLIKGASFIEINKKVYTSVPKNIKIYYEGKKSVTGTQFMMEQE